MAKERNYHVKIIKIKLCTLGIHLQIYNGDKIENSYLFDRTVRHALRFKDHCSRHECYRHHTDH
jgi:hypothetical protein